MLFHAPQFIFVFLPIVLAVYFAVNFVGNYRAANVWLVLSSLFFYGYWNPVYLVLILASIATNYAIGVELQRRKTTDTGHGLARAGMVAGVVLNIGLLAYFKYTHFIVGNINLVAGSNISIEAIVLPLAISFFTFQQIAYLSDSYKGKVSEHDFVDYCLFVTFFPQLISGPIVHHSEMMPQFRDSSRRRVRSHNLGLGILVFSIGLFKKVVVADTFNAWTSVGFDSNAQLGLVEAWGSLLSYTFELYYDFSGYTDMAIGLGLMFNIRLPRNFNSPYKSTSITEFWQRWHMTLMRWMRDYLYIPLRKRRPGEVNAVFSLVATFLVTGLWHGSSWLFVTFGLMHGGAMVVHRLWKKAGFRMSRVAGCCLTFLFFSLSLVIFRSSTFADVERFAWGLSGLNGIRGGVIDFCVNDVWSTVLPSLGCNAALPSLPLSMSIFLVVFGGLTFVARNSNEIADSVARFRYWHVLLVSFTLLFALLGGIQNDPAVFIYYQF